MIIDSSSSVSIPVTSGVIQGSVLGPTLFNLFINEIDNVLTHCKLLKYADDLRIFLSSDKKCDSIYTMQRNIQDDIDNL